MVKDTIIHLKKKIVKSALQSFSTKLNPWLVTGFTEAEGSFYLVAKSSQRLVHAFEITQKLDVIVLEAIARILKIKVIKKKTYFTVKATGSNEIEFIVKYYFKTMKGMKALEYRIWGRSFNKDSCQKILNI